MKSEVLAYQEWSFDWIWLFKKKKSNKFQDQMKTKNDCLKTGKQGRITNAENKLMVTKGKAKRDKLGDWDWHIHITTDKTYH